MDDDQRLGASDMEDKASTYRHGTPLDTEHLLSRLHMLM